MKIAIIDDNQVNLVLLKRMVEQHFQFQPHLFSDSWQGLEWCLANDPDLVLVDYMMPGLDGLGFVTSLRAAPSCADTPIVMITANHDNQLRYEALDAGANDFLTKPVDQVEFKARVKNMLALRKSQIALRDRASWLADEVAKATADVKAREREAIFLLSRAAEYRDPETGAHILRMAAYSALIANEIGLPQDRVALILEAAPMHDIGKVGTPDRILLKPGRLDPDEMTIMREHARNGYEILRESSSPLLQLAATIAMTHHEKFDGSGYPNSLAGEAIPIEGRIVALADVFDALTSARPYKPAWEIDRAVEFIQSERGRHFDPVLIDAFMKRFADVLTIRQQHQDDPKETAA